MAYNRRVVADETLGATITLSKGAAELVDRGFGIDADGDRVLPYVRAREDARRPPRQIVSFEAPPEIRGDPCRFREPF